MNKPARRDGTPDRSRRQPARGSEDPRSDRRAPASNDRRAPAAGDRRAASAGDRKPARKSAPSTQSVRSNEAVPRKKPPFVAGRPAPAAKAAATGKAPRPQKKHVPAPTISNAKPARHQNTDTKRKHVPAGEGVRLQKVLAQAGVASRRAAEALIDDGRVEVDGRLVTEQGIRIDPNTAVVRVDGTRVVVKEELVHLAMNKPRGWQCTMSDDLGRPCVGDIVAERVQSGQRLFHVGRLDAATEGLLLLTNDGDLAHRLMHPSFEVSKTYLATLNGSIPRGIGKQLREGVVLEDGPVKVDGFSVLDISEGKSLVKVVLHEGRKHIVRRLFDQVGFPVTRLVRTDIGVVALGDQRPGTMRVLGRGEVGALYEAVGL